MADPTDKAREEFYSEAQEIIEALSRNLLALDDALKAGGSDPSLINEAFRSVHTLKGLAGLFGANKMGALPSNRIMIKTHFELDIRDASLKQSVLSVISSCLRSRRWPNSLWRVPPFQDR